MGTQTAPISDGNLITVATVRAVDWTRNHSCCKKLTSAAQVLTFWRAYHTTPCLWMGLLDRCQYSMPCAWAQLWERTEKEVQGCLPL